MFFLVGGTNILKATYQYVALRFFKYSISTQEIDLEEKLVTLLAQVPHSDVIILLNKFSSPRKIQGIVAYILRFIANTKHPSTLNGPLSLEEFHTALLLIVKFVQIELVLNSQPLCALSSDPNDLSVLTPRHFLTLEPLTAAVCSLYSPCTKPFGLHDLYQRKVSSV